MLRGLFNLTDKPKAVAHSETKFPRSDTVLGVNAHLEGTLKCDGDVRIDGTLKGDVVTKGRVMIGEQGRLEGDLVSEAVTVAGMLRGNITARKVAIRRTGRVWGDLRLESLVTEEGSFIQGVITMEETVDLAEPATKVASDNAKAAEPVAVEGGETRSEKIESPIKPKRSSLAELERLTSRPKER